MLSKASGKHTARAIFAVAATFIKIGLAIRCFVLRVTGALVGKEANSPLLEFIIMYAVEALIVFGVFTTLLWLPWEQYVKQSIFIVDSYELVSLAILANHL